MLSGLFVFYYMSSKGLLIFKSRLTLLYIMSKLIDNELPPAGISIKKIVQRLINLYALFISSFLLLFFLNLNIKTQPTPLAAENALEVQSSYSMLAGICINVGDCGNDQVVLGLKDNIVSQKLYQFLIWKQRNQGRSNTD